MKWVASSQALRTIPSFDEEKMKWERYFCKLFGHRKAEWFWWTTQSGRRAGNRACPRCKTFAYLIEGHDEKAIQGQTPVV